MFVTIIFKDIVNDLESIWYTDLPNGVINELKRPNLSSNHLEELKYRIVFMLKLPTSQYKILSITDKSNQIIYRKNK